MNNKTAGVDQLAQISEKLDTVVGFLAVRGIESDPSAMIERLRGLGVGTKVIARVTGMTGNAVAIRLTRMKKKISNKAPQPD